MARVILKAGHILPVAFGHPWIFAQAIQKIEGEPAPGEALGVYDPKEKFLGQGFWSPKSAIPIKILSRHADEALDIAFFRRRLEHAKKFREETLGLPSKETNGFRLVNAEGDGLSGLIVDRYDDVAVVQFLTFGLKQREEMLARLIQEVFSVRAVIERASPQSQKKEGFQVENQTVLGPEVKALVFLERGFKYELELDLLTQKTGFYFDQRENRGLIESISDGRRVLDACSYVGAFSLAAARGGAKEVLALDNSANAIALGALIAKHNQVHEKIKFVKADIRHELTHLAREKNRFDLLILDPPKLMSHTRAVRQAQSYYRFLNAQAMRLVEDDGLMFTCSCSSLLTEATFLRVLTQAAKDAQREVTVLATAGQAPCHPTPIALVQGRYLTCALLRIAVP